MKSNTSPSSETAVLKQLLHKDLEFATDAQNFEEIHTKLKVFIQHLLNHDFEKLIQALYRIDLDESSVKEVLTVETPDHIASTLSEMIIDRQWKKVITRMQYR